MNEPILVVMAAGLGSRYGGLKQIDPLGNHGDFIIDYALFDAIQAEFKRVIFIINREIELDFKETIGNRISKYIDVQYVYQELDSLPYPYEIPKGRTKPWGTGHAILCCKEVIDAPFAVINADDYYGCNAFKAIYKYLRRIEDTSKYQYIMVGYRLKNTVTDYGHVSRGICQMNDMGYLSHIKERTHVISDDGLWYKENGQYFELDEASIVSMNLWGFTTSIIKELEVWFEKFLDEGNLVDPLKDEFFLPEVVGKLVKANKAEVKIIQSNERWYGVTYQEDKLTIIDALSELKKKGCYPENLWESKDDSY